MKQLKCKSRLRDPNCFELGPRRRLSTEDKDKIRRIKALFLFDDVSVCFVYFFCYLQNKNRTQVRGSFLTLICYVAAQIPLLFYLHPHSLFTMITHHTILIHTLVCLPGIPPGNSTQKQVPETNSCVRNFCPPTLFSPPGT
jgi:hypothetical protein